MVFKFRAEERTPPARVSCRRDMSIDRGGSLAAFQLVRLFICSKPCGRPVAVSAVSHSKRSFCRPSAIRWPNIRFKTCRSLANSCWDTLRTSSGLLKSISTTHTPHSITAPGRVRITKAHCLSLLWVVIIRLSYSGRVLHSLKNAGAVRQPRWQNASAPWCCVRSPG